MQTGRNPHLHVSTHGFLATTQFLLECRCCWNLLVQMLLPGHEGNWTVWGCHPCGRWCEPTCPLLQRWQINNQLRSNPEDCQPAHCSAVPMRPLGRIVRAIIGRTYPCTHLVVDGVNDAFKLHLLWHRRLRGIVKIWVWKVTIIHDRHFLICRIGAKIEWAASGRYRKHWPRSWISFAERVNRKKAWGEGAVLCSILPTWNGHEPLSIVTPVKDYTVSFTPPRPSIDIHWK